MKLSLNLIINFKYFCYFSLENNQSKVIAPTNAARGPPRVIGP
jgi:hypothetical protein